MQYKARRDGYYIKPEWETFVGWIDDVGPKPEGNYYFCRHDWYGPWNTENAGWQLMPKGRKRSYRRGYADSN